MHRLRNTKSTFSKIANLSYGKVELYLKKLLCGEY
jgi:hypothetical protein